MLQSVAGVGLLALGTVACDGEGPESTFPNGPPEAATGARLREMVIGLSMPLFLTSPVGDLNRQFVVEKLGRIRIIKDGGLVPTPFLDITQKVSNGGEQGLLGLAFHPQYATNGSSSSTTPIPAGDTRVAIYRVSADPDRADAASEQVILAVDQPFSNHNGGMVAFGPDGCTSGWATAATAAIRRATARIATASSASSCGSA